MRHMRLRTALAATAVAVVTLSGTLPASASTSQVVPLAKAFTKAGFTCEVKKPISNYREANCTKGDSRVNVVAFSGASALSTWLPTFCAVNAVFGFNRYLTNGATWVVGSPDVSSRDLRRIVKAGTVKTCSS